MKHVSAEAYMNFAEIISNFVCSHDFFGLKIGPFKAQNNYYAVANVDFTRHVKNTCHGRRKILSQKPPPNIWRNFDCAIKDSFEERGHVRDACA